MKLIEIDTACNVEVLEIQGDIGKFIRSRFNGYMEVVYPRRLDSPYVMIVDEEGLLKELPVNPVGCGFYQTDQHGIPIVGKIIIAKIKRLPDGDMDIAGLTDEELADFGRRYGCGITVIKLAVRKEVE